MEKRAEISPQRVVWTIGHSHRTWGEFLPLLVEHGIQWLADVRSYPRSRRHPQFDRENLRSALLEAGIFYQHFPELGGLRDARLERSPNTAWPEGGFRNYADYMLSDEFRQGVESLLQTCRAHATVVLCAEADPYRCHRQLLSDYLVLVNGMQVLHILEPGRAEAHAVRPRARLEKRGVVYPPLQGSLF